MAIYISTPEILQRYRISKGTLKNMRERGSDPFPEPIIRGHGRATNLYGVKAVASWESRNGYLEALEIEPLISNLS
ncbi:hypothetical protein P254_00736 [Acinetobacter oleivorans CIP 110421]|nr:hypothetical protein [Acinetobacter oleivorans]ESK45125.1 hypothetical protein P254_00736 [Acinetobacter oleivorans CIP 110421]